MGMRVLIALAYLAAVMSMVSAESIPVYFGTYTGGSGASQGIYRSILNLETGELSNPVLAARATNPSFLEIHPNGRFLYAVSESGGSGSVSAFEIDSDTGDLGLLNREPSGGEAGRWAGGGGGARCSGGGDGGAADGAGGVSVRRASPGYDTAGTGGNAGTLGNW